MKKEGFAATPAASYRARRFAPWKATRRRKNSQADVTGEWRGLGRKADVFLRAGKPVGDRYVLERLVGSGGMGQVWAGREIATGRKVAVKVFRNGLVEADARRRVLNEANTSCSVEHPAVVPVIDVLEMESGGFALVMELLHGESLTVRAKPMRVSETARLLLPIAEALSAAHAVGIVHRDVKPDNIFVTTMGQAKLLDFGIAKTIVVDAIAATSAAAQTGAIVGTTQYMSPEQAFAERDIDHRTDIWSLGLVLYECLTGVLPTQADSLGQVLKIILTGAIPSVGKHGRPLPAELVALVDKMLQQDRTQRPQSMSDVTKILEAILKDANASEDGLVVRVGGSDSNDACGATQLPASSISSLAGAGVADSCEQHARPRPCNTPKSPRYSTWARAKAPRTWRWSTSRARRCARCAGLLAEPARRHQVSQVGGRAILRVARLAVKHLRDGEHSVEARAARGRGLVVGALTCGGIHSSLGDSCLRAALLKNRSWIRDVYWLGASFGSAEWARVAPVTCVEVPHARLWTGLADAVCSADTTRYLARLRGQAQLIAPAGIAAALAGDAQYYALAASAAQRC